MKFQIAIRTTTSITKHLAATLLKLRQYDDARREALRAVECMEPYGHAVEAWTTWNILHNLERACGNSEAAAQARQRAIEIYLAYRRAGGQSETDSMQLYALAAQAIMQGEINDVSRQIAELSAADIPPHARVLLSKLEAVLRGESNAALADDPDLYYQDAAELRLLLEALTAR